MRTLEDVEAVVREQGVPRGVVDRAVSAHRNHLRREPKCLLSGCVDEPTTSLFLSIPGSYLFVGSICDRHCVPDVVDSLAARVASERGAPACQVAGWVPIDVLLADREV